MLEDPGSYGYFREEGGGLMLGLFEPVCAPWKVERRPGRLLLRRAPARLGPDGAVRRDGDAAACPIAVETGIRTFFCGPESFTPDLQPVVGEAPELRGYFVAAGLNSIGILTGGGLGRVVAHWIVDGRPDVDVTGCNIDRLHRYQTNPEYRATRTVESLGLVYQCHYPDRSMQTARGAKVSPVHDRLAAQRRVLQGRQRLGGRRLVRARRAPTPDAERAVLGPAGAGSRTGRPSTAPPARA